MVVRGRRLRRDEVPVCPEAEGRAEHRRRGGAAEEGRPRAAVARRGAPGQGRGPQDVLQLDFRSEEHAHIGDDDRGTVRDAASKASEWLLESLEKQGSLEQCQDPVLLPSHIKDKLYDLDQATRPILTKPKPLPPKAAPPPPADAPPAEAKEEDGDAKMDDAAAAPDAAAAAPETPRCPRRARGGPEAAAAARPPPFGYAHPRAGRRGRTAFRRACPDARKLRPLLVYLRVVTRGHLS